jgi:hypothetical protein
MGQRHKFLFESPSAFDEAIEDPLMVELPNAEKLKQLPLRALVAYAVRCAMRVQLLYLKWQDGPAQSGPPAGMVEAVAEAIDLATRYAAQEGDYDLKRAQALEETVIEAVMRAKGGHRGAAFAANAAYAALNAANLASCVSNGPNRRADAEKVVSAVITAADAAAAAHDGVIQAALDDWHALGLMRSGQFPEAGKPVDPRPEGKLGPLSNKKQPTAGWRDKSPTLKQIKKHENVLEQTREELVFQQEERKKDKAAHEAKCDEYEKTIRQLKGEVIPLKKERDELKQKHDELQAEIESLKRQFADKDQEQRIRLTEFAGQLLEWAEPKPLALKTKVPAPSVKQEPSAKNSAPEPPKPPAPPSPPPTAAEIKEAFEAVV